MKLFLNKTSPYARMIRIILLEKNMIENLELCWCDPWSDDKDLLAENPVGKIPTLVLDTGLALSESLLIAFYLDSKDPSNHLLQNNLQEKVLHLAGLGQGLMDSAFTTVITKKYLNDSASESVLSQRRERAIQRTLEYLEENIPLYSALDAISMGDISVAVALNYLALRLPELNTANKYQKLELWRQKVSTRPSFKDTSFD